MPRSRWLSCSSLIYLSLRTSLSDLSSMSNAS
jgi:hypothetical protein